MVVGVERPFPPREGQQTGVFCGRGYDAELTSAVVQLRPVISNLHHDILSNVLLQVGDGAGVKSYMFAFLNHMKNYYKDLFCGHNR